MQLYTNIPDLERSLFQHMSCSALLDLAFSIYHARAKDDISSKTFKICLTMPTLVKSYMIAVLRGIVTC